jgi:hypothetical protein
MREDGNERGKMMTKALTGMVALSLFGFASVGVAAAADKTALQKATADCRAQVKEQAKYKEMSMYARHKAVKQCAQQATTQQ